MSNINMKKVSADGHTYYYYYKKKIGRHKKSGPKKKPKKRGPKHTERWFFKIIKCNFNKQVDFIGFYHNIEEAEFARKILEERNAAIVFPKKYISNSLKNWNVYEQKSEYLILERNIDGGEGVTQLRNEFGKLIDHKTENGKWKIYAKFPCLEEETFWAYGYSPKTDRKTFDWIYENFALAHAQSKYDFVNIYIYNNKVIFRYDNKDFNFVLCKNTSDAIRMYNLIEERSKKNKQIIMTGGTSGNCDRTNEIVQMIKEKTGWPLTSIRKSSTRH